MLQFSNVITKVIISEVFISIVTLLRHDTQHNDTQVSDIWQSNTQCNGLKCDAWHKWNSAKCCECKLLSSRVPQAWKISVNISKY
jgi:hypothetical protein